MYKRQSPTCQIAIEKAVGHVVFLIGTEVHLDNLKRPQLATCYNFREFPINRHMENGHGFSQFDMVFFSKLYRFCQFLTVESDGLFTEYVLASCEGLAKVINMRIVRG